MFCALIHFSFEFEDGLNAAFRFCVSWEAGQYVAYVTSLVFISVSLSHRMKISLGLTMRKDLDVILNFTAVCVRLCSTSGSQWAS